MPDLTLDVFNQEPFSTVSLTDAINNVPFVPGRAGEVAGWEEEGITTTSIMLDEKNGELVLINPTPRGGPGQTSKEPSRKARSLVVPHYQHDDFILADSVQNVRSFGSSNALESLQDVVNSRLQQHVRWKLDPTLEHQRVGAIKGVILNGDGSTLYDLFAEFGVAQEAEIDFDLDNASPASGALRKKCTEVVRKVSTNLGGVGFRYVHALCSDSFWDDLIAHTEVRQTYLNQAEAAQLRGNAAYEVLDYGGIRFENYRGAAGTTPFIADAKAHFFPVGVPGLWRTIYSPADYEETVNTIGLPRYAKQYSSPNGKGRHLESQMNAINYCTRPKVLIKGRRT